MSSVAISFLVVLAAAAIGYGVHFIPNVKEDNVIEEECEKIIKDKTNLDIDLTPSSPEKKDE